MRNQIEMDQHFKMFSLFFFFFERAQNQQSHVLCMTLKKNETIQTASTYYMILSQLGHNILVEGSCKHSEGQDYSEYEMILRSQRIGCKSGRKSTKYYP